MELFVVEDVTSSNGKFRSSENSIVDYNQQWVINSDGTFITASDPLVVGDVVQMNPQNYMERTLSKIHSMSVYNLGSKPKPWLLKVFHSIRPMPKGPNNKFFSVVFGLIEISYLKEDLKIFENFKEILGHQYHHLITWLSSLFELPAFSERIRTLTYYFSATETIVKVLYQIYQGDIIQMVQGFNCALRIFSYPTMTMEILNSKGKPLLTYLEIQNNLNIIYSSSESTLMSSPNYKDFIEGYLRSCEVTDCLSSQIKSNVEFESRKSSKFLILITNFITAQIKLGAINDRLFEIIEIANDLGINKTSFLTLIDAYICFNCKQVKELLLLQCGHRYCLLCFDDLVKVTTQGKYVLNELEKSEADPTRCRNNCEQIITDEIKKKYLPDYEKYEKQAEERVKLICNCGFEGKIKNFLMKCKHRCNFCLFDLAKRGVVRCPECNISINQDIENCKLMRQKCDGCLREFSCLKGFPKKMCDHNLCFECASECTTGCLIDGKALELLEGENLNELNKVECKHCKSKYRRMELFNLAKDCFCNYCEECQCQGSVENCCVCHKKFSQELIEHLSACRVRFESYRKPCRVCQIDYSLDEVVEMINCQHIFCKTCINEFMNFHLGEGDIEKMMKCLDSDCKVEIYSSQLETIVSKEAWLRISSYSLQLNGIKLIDCPKCNEKMIPGFQLKVVCVQSSCGYIFCQGCREQYHESGNCIEAFISARTKELEQENGPENVSQCPRCRIPYLKDDHCDHVVCMNADCKVHFCFICSCLRSPTMEHGNHYHRPGCKNGSDFNGEGDAMRPKCTECARYGKLCPRPKALRVPRRIAEDEVS